MDGKKKPSITPPGYVADLYDPIIAARRNGYPTLNSYYGHQNYPLSGTYKEPTIPVNLNSNSSEREKESKEKFKDSAAYWLCLYFCFNLGLTLFNKVVLVSFPFPYVGPSVFAFGWRVGRKLM